MGCPNLWKCLAEAGLIESLKGGVRGDYERIVKELQGKIVAVDCSVWQFEVKSIAQLQHSFSSQTAAFIKVVLDKISNMLRLGCTPVLVFEGEVDKSKYELMEQRYQRAYAGKGRVNRCKEIEKFADALGIVTVRAPGEGEAMCAALDALGLVDGCVTCDADALAFGAQTVYKTFSVSAKTVRMNEMEICRLSAAHQLFGICSGGTLAMRLLMLLSGGDYNLGGTRNVGHVKSLATVQTLLKDKLDDLDLIDDFWASLFNTELPEEPPARRACTGCRTCGCPLKTKTRRIDKHGRAGCAGCGTHAIKEGGNGEGGCIPMDDGETCRCPFCLWRHGDAGKREVVNKVFNCARRQSVQHTTLDNALKTYERQKDQAFEAARVFAHKSDLAWQHRPDMDALTQMLGKHLQWDAETVRSKLMPVLLDWDASHRYDPDTEFEVSEVLSLGTKGRQLGNQTSQITVRFQRKEDVHVATKDADMQWLAERINGGRWSLQKPLIDSFYADLVREFKNKKGKKDKDVGAPSRKITEFFKQEDKTDSCPAEAPTEYSSPDLKSEDVAQDEPPRKMPKLSVSPSPSQTGDLSAAKTPKKSRVISYSTTMSSIGRKPYGVSRLLKKRLNDVHEDIRQYCSPVKKTKEPSKDKKEEGTASLTPSLGSVPRRLTAITIDSPVQKPHLRCGPLSRPDDIEMKTIKDDAVTPTVSPSLPVYSWQPPEIEEEVDLLTPRGNDDDAVEGSVIDLLSEASKRL